jgi:hypothetical protein
MTSIWEIYCSIKIFKQNEVKKLRDQRFQVRRDKLCVCAKMKHRSGSLIAIKRRIFCETFIFVKRVIFAYLFVFVQTANFAASAVACGGIDIRG